MTNKFTNLAAAAAFAATIASGQPVSNDTNKGFETKSLDEVLKGDSSIKENTKYAVSDIITIPETRKDSTVNVNSSGVSLTKNGDIKQTISVGAVGSANQFNDSNSSYNQDNTSPNFNQGIKTNLSLQSNNGYIDWKADLGVTQSISNISGGDTILEASLSTIYAGSSLGTYIGVKKGSDFEKFVIAQGFSLGNNGKLKISAAILERIMEFNFGEFGSKKENMKQSSFGVDYTYNYNGILQDLKTSVIYYDVNGKNLGTIGNIILDTATVYDWTRVEGAIGGGSKILAGVDANFKLTEELKAGVGIGIDKSSYDAVLDKAGYDVTKMTTRLSAEYQPTNYDNIKLSANTYEGSNNIDARYTHDFGNGIKGYAGVAQTNYSNSGIESDKRVFAGLNYTFGGSDQKSKLPTLFNETHNSQLTHSDVIPNYQVAIDNIIAPVRTATKNEHLVNIDKTIAGVSIDKNLDGTLKFVNLDTGKTISSIDSIYVNGVLSSVADISFNGSNIVISHFEKLQAPATYKVVLLNADSTYTLYEFTTTKGSVELITTPTYLNDASSTEKDEYKSGSKSISQIITDRVHPDAATILGATTTSNVTNNSLTVTNHITDADGIQNINYYIYSDVAGNNLVATNTTGNFSGLSGNATYYVKTSADVKNGTTNNFSTVNSSLVSVTTLANDIASVIGNPITNSVTNTSFSVTNNITDTDGIQNVNYYIYSDAAGNNLVATNTTGNFSGLSGNTTYYVKTSADVKNGTTNNFSTVSSSLVSVTTLANDIAAVIRNPATSSVTNNSLSVTNNITDTDGIQNVNYYIYSDAAGNNLVATNTTGNFSGLSGNTTYYVKTSADVKNGTTNNFSTVSSSLVSVTTLANDIAAVIGNPVSSSVTDTSFSITNNITDADGIQNITYYVYSDAAGNNLVLQNTTGNFSGLSGNATYYVKTSADVKNGTTGNFSNVSSSLVSVTTLVTPDTTPPVSPTGLSLNSGATYTNSTTVSLDGLTGAADVAAWFVSESSSAPLASNGVWTSSKPTSYTMSSGDGVKTVYVYVKDAAGNVQQVGVSDTIILDTVTPSTANWLGTTPDTQTSSYSGLELDLGENLSGGSITSITSSTGGTISNVSINGSGNAVFDWITPNAGGSQLTITGTDRAGNAFTIHKNITLPNTPNTAPVVTDISLSGTPNPSYGVLGRREATINMSGYISDDKTPAASLVFSNTNSNPNITIDTSSWPIINVTANEGRSGFVDFTYTVNDGQLNSNTGNIHLDFNY